MIIYLLKVVLCSALFLGCYFLLFQREKIYRFNRFYLLFSLFIPFIIPLIEVENGSTPINIPQVENVFMPTQEVQQITVEKQVFVAPKQAAEIDLLLWIYTLVSASLLLIFLKNIFVLIKEMRNNKKIVSGEIYIVLLERKITPYSFMKYVFVNRNEYEKQGIEKEIFLHEITHIKQLHSVDILFFEVVKVFLWFNPLLFFYKKVIQLNHEFLADEAVINRYKNITDYQYLLIEKSSQPNRFIFTSSFNYSITKQRLKMMTKSTSKTKALLIISAFIPLFASAIFVFSTKIYAQKSTPEIKERRVASTKEGASDEMLAEYVAIIKKYLKEMPKDTTSFMALENFNINLTDEKRMRIIFKSMSKEQQNAQNLIVFVFSDLVIPRKIPTKEEFENYKDPAKYAIWIDGKKVENSELNKYNSSDLNLFTGKNTDIGLRNIIGTPIHFWTTESYEEHKKLVKSNTKQAYVVTNWKKLKAEFFSE